MPHLSLAMSVHSPAEVVADAAVVAGAAKFGCPKQPNVRRLSKMSPSVLAVATSPDGNGCRSCPSLANGSGSNSMTTSSFVDVVVSRWFGAQVRSIRGAIRVGPQQLQAEGGRLQYAWMSQHVRRSELPSVFALPDDARPAKIRDDLPSPRCNDNRLARPRARGSGHTLSQNGYGNQVVAVCAPHGASG